MLKEEVRLKLPEGFGNKNPSAISLLRINDNEGMAEGLNDFQRVKYVYIGRGVCQVVGTLHKGKSVRRHDD